MNDFLKLLKKNAPNFITMVLVIAATVVTVIALGLQTKTGIVTIGHRVPTLFSVWCYTDGSCAFYDYVSNECRPCSATDCPRASEP